MKRVIYSLMVVVLTAALLLGCAPAPAPKAEPIVLKAVSFRVETNPVLTGFFKLIDRVNERAKGELIIEYTGGPAAIPAREQAAAVRKGIADITINPTAFYDGMFLEAELLTLSEYTPREERERGIYDSGLYT